MKIKISYCMRSLGFRGGLSPDLGTRYYIEASTEVIGKVITAQSEETKERITFEQAEALKKEAKIRLIEKVNKIIEEEEDDRKMSEILSSEEVEL